MIEVYYAEDDEIIGKSVKEYLEQQNCKITVFGSIADIRKALLNHLPTDRLVETAKDCKRYKILTKNTYANTVMKESDRAVMEEFIDDIKVVINALGHKALEPFLQKKNGNDSSDDLLYISTGATKAEGKTTTEGLVLLQGAVVNEKMNAKSVNAGIVKLREKCVEEEKIKDLVTTEDLLFSSSSAADFVLGYSVSGPRTWKDKNGKSLKEIETEKSE